MSTLKVLKEYLVGKGGYLLNDDNNGKTVMLSGAWGSGKTHFWLEDIKPKLTENNQKNIYISLYGKESIGELKFEVLRKAYNLEVKEDFISKTASMISSIAPSLGEKSLVDGYDKLNKAAKEKQAEEILKLGSIICLDDFERKSSKIDLNDLFGYISQLALDYKCKVVIILNSDVFEGEEANVFKTVKEKTVNKFFYFEPTIEELFDSIYNSNEKYKRLDDYKDEILSAIKETEELNARIYIQVLDNCLEWIEKGYDKSLLRNMTLCTVFFVKYHLTLTRTNNKYDVITKVFLDKGFDEIAKILNTKTYFNSSAKKTSAIATVYNKLHEDKENEGSEDFYKKQNEIINENSDLVYDFVKYTYLLEVEPYIESSLYTQMNNFIKSGILLNNNKEQSL